MTDAARVRQMLIRSPTVAVVAADPEHLAGPVPIARRWGWAGLGVFVVFLVVGVVARTGANPAGAAGEVTLGLAGAIPLFLVRSRGALAAAAVAAAGVVLAGNADAHDIGWFALLVIVAWVILAGGTRLGLICWVSGVAVFAAEWAWAVRDPGWAPWTAGLTATAVAMVLVRHQLVLVEALRSAQAGLAARSAAEERNRIAREIHDVIAHCLTVSLLHISAARLAIETDPSGAATALVEAERLGRQSLDEVRATMGLLGIGTAAAGVAPPVPEAGQIPELVEQFRRAGAEVTFTVQGAPETLPATTGSAVYRIAQEALTNAIKHASGSVIEVRLDIGGERVELTVESSGPPGHGSGMGLDGMRYRATAVGGSCRAGPHRGGWQVHTSLPVSAAPSAVPR